MFSFLKFVPIEDFLVIFLNTFVALFFLFYIVLFLRFYYIYRPPSMYDTFTGYIPFIRKTRTYQILDCLFLIFLPFFIASYTTVFACEKRAIYNATKTEDLESIHFLKAQAISKSSKIKKAVISNIIDHADMTNPEYIEIIKTTSKDRNPDN